MKDLENGDCYEVAAKLLLDPDNSLPDDARLVHGMPTLQREPFEKYGHAWIEIRGCVIDCSNGRSVAVPTDKYYRVGNIDSSDCFRYSREETWEKVFSHEHYGPWEGTLAHPPAADFADGDNRWEDPR